MLVIPAPAAGFGDGALTKLAGVLPVVGHDPSFSRTGDGVGGVLRDWRDTSDFWVKGVLKHLLITILIVWVVIIIWLAISLSF